eukprot:XP_019930409.1 PREDICTED: protein mesh [Crassostrea gigas]
MLPVAKCVANAEDIGMRSILVAEYFAFVVGPALGLSLNDLYPFGDQAGDTAMNKNDDGSSPDIPISTLFPFFNHQHTKLIVNTNGVISFLRPVGTYTPNPFPIANDARMIAPFWADIDTTRGGTVWYRETTNDTMLDRATDEVRAYFPDFFRFRASWVFIATWDRVAFFGCSGGGCSKNNTFQAVLITNGQHSFTIYNYEDIQWTTGTASRGNSTTGLGGTPAQVGFNAGDGIVSFTVNASRSPDIVNVDEDSNVDIPGKFAFRIDASDISDGGCNTKGRLTITPRYGPMLGGQYLVISGPCIEPGATIELTFLGLPDKKNCERKTEFSMACITPMFLYTGDAIVQVVIEDQQGDRKTFLGRYTIINPADSKHRAYRHSASDWFSGRQQISWDPDVAELKDDEKVDIHLFYLKEEGNRGLKWQKEILKQGVQRLLGTTELFLPTSGYALAVRVTSSPQRNDQFERGIWSDIFPLALRSDQAYSLCKNWLNTEVQLPPLPSDDVQPCPCTLDQALLDIVRFQPDPDCNIFNRNSQFSRTGNCLHRRDAAHCIRLTDLGQQMDNLCCYDSSNNLIDSRLKEGGSLQRYHYLGGSRIYPYLTNFYFDVLPFLHCCRYTRNGYNVVSGGNIVVAENICPRFFTHRKYSSCENYEPPRPARTNGDPHITTLDGYSYTFNGVGEFVYLKTTDGTFQSQIRFEQFRKENGDLVDASVCTAIATQHTNTSGVVEVRLNSIRTADILVDGEVIDFDESNAHQFPGAFVLQIASNDSNINSTKKEFIVSFTEIGIAFKAIASSKVLNILPIVGNKSLAGSLRGLLGDFDENPNNDLQTDSGRILYPNSSTEQIFDDFGVSWRITENSSLFTYEPGKSYDDYQLRSFRPAFSLPTNLPPEGVDLCGTDQECAFDYAVTDSADLAAETLQITVIFNTSVEASYEIKNCANLPSVVGGVWNASSTLEGSNATFSCYPGYEMDGESNIVSCRNNSWGDFGNFSCVQINTSSTLEVTPTLFTTEKETSIPTTSTFKEIITTTTMEATTTTEDVLTTTMTTTSETEEISTTTDIPITSTSQTSTTSLPTTSTSQTSTTSIPPTSTTQTSTMTSTKQWTTAEISKSTDQPTIFTTEKTSTTTYKPTALTTQSTTAKQTTSTTEETSITTPNQPKSSTESTTTTQTISTTEDASTEPSHQTKTWTTNVSTISVTHQTSTLNIKETLQQFDEQFNKILPYVIGGVVVIIVLSVVVGILFLRRFVQLKKKKNNSSGTYTHTDGFTFYSHETNK